MADDAKTLELRITRLEDAISKLAGARKAVDISAEEMKTYLKVRDAFNIDTCFCGINDCMACVRCLRCSRCTSCFRCAKCINECICGPCSCFQGGGGFGGGFGDLGG